MTVLRITELARTTGTNAPTIRYYEEIGLLPKPWRQDGNQRRYGQEDVKRLTFIRRCRDFGFSIDQVRSLAGLMQDDSRSCMDARTMASTHLDHVREKLKELLALERSIAAFVERCDATCVGGPGPECTILEDLVVTKLANGCCR